MYYRYVDEKKWTRINSKKFFSDPILSNRYRDKDIEIKHESCSPKQKEQRLKFVRNGKIHLAIANLKSVYHDKSIKLSPIEALDLTETIKVLKAKLI